MPQPHAAAHENRPNGNIQLHYIKHSAGGKMPLKNEKLSVMKNKLLNLARTGGASALLLLLMLVGATQAKAQKTYGLKIAGVDITSDNYSRISSFTGVNGVTYDPNSNVLTLDNATIALQGNTEAITNYADNGLVINITGENKITSNQSALSLACPTTLQGGGTLNATSVNGSGIAINNATLTVTPCTVNAKGVYGLSGNGDGAILSVKINSEITAEGSEGSVVGMASLDLESNIDLDSYVSPEDEGIAIIKPSRAEFDKTQKAVVVKGEVTTQKVVIGKLIVYDMRINNQHVTNANCNDLSVIPGVSGAMIYDPDNYTLTLQNAVINTEFTGWAIRHDARYPHMTIKLFGENHIITYGAPFGITLAPVTITGGGSLDILSASPIYGDSITFDDCTVNIKCYASRAIKGTYTRSVCTIRDADITAERLDTINTRYSAISDLKSLVLDECEIVEPEGAAFDESLHGIGINGKPAAKVVIRRTSEKYGFKVAGTQVTSKNCNDLSVIDGVSGTATYDPEKKTLYLKDATIETTGDIKGIENESAENLIINVTGENTIKANYSAIVLNNNPTIINGYGTLSAEAGKGMGLYFNNSLEIDNCTANFNGSWGLAGYDGSSEKLTVNNATVTMKGTESSHSDLNSLTLVNSVISSPKGAAFSEALHAIALNGKAVTSSVTIRPDTTKRYDVVLEECSDNKSEVVALVQSVTGLGATESAALVDSAPCIISSDLTPGEAQRICNAFAKLNCASNGYLHGTWTPTGIQNVNATDVEPRKQGIYSIDGVYLGNDLKALPRGVYVKDGKKVLK